MKINNIILMLRTCIIFLSSFTIYFFCVCLLGSFPIIYLSLFISPLRSFYFWVHWFEWFGKKNPEFLTVLFSMILGLDFSKNNIKAVFG